MGLVTLPVIWIAKQLVPAASLNADFNAILNQLNGNIDATNLANLAVTAAKLGNLSVTGPKIGMGSDAQGDILFRGATQYQRLAAGTAGQLLKTNGAGADPAWADPAFVQSGYVDLATALTINAAKAYDDNAPVITDGIQVLKITGYTPKSTGSKIFIQAGVQGAGSGASVITMAALWYGSTLVGVQWNESYSTSAEQIIIQPFQIAPGSVTPQDIQLRVATVSGTPYYINADGSNGHTSGDAKQTSLSVMEVG
jgi:hypothetical protein